MKNSNIIYGVLDYDNCHIDIGKNLDEVKKSALDGGYNIITKRFNYGYDIDNYLYLWGNVWVNDIGEAISESGYTVDFLFSDCEIPFYKLYDIERTINQLNYYYDKFESIPVDVLNNISEKLYKTACRYGDYYTNNKSSFDADLLEFISFDIN